MVSSDGPKNVWGEPNDRPIEVEGSCVTRTANALMVGTAAGTFFGSCQLAWYPDPVTSERRFGGVAGKTDFHAIVRGLSRPAMWMAASAGAFAAVECAAESARGRKDSWNAFWGGMAAGAVIGATTKRFDIMFSTALGTGLLVAALDFHGPNVEREPFQLREKMHGVLPVKHQESDALRSLKEKYPKWENL